MEPDKTRRAEAIQRTVEMAMAPLRVDVETMAEISDVASASGGAGARPTAQATGGEPVKVLETYGFASTPPGEAQALVVAPGTADEDRVTTGLSAPAGRPATSAGDAVTWTNAGHSVLLDDDGGITVTSKDGSTIDLPASGAINITAGTGASITLNVDPGAFVDSGGAGAGKLTLAGALQTFLAGAFSSAPVGVQDGGLVLKNWLAAKMAGVLPAPPPSLSAATETSRARGL